MLAALRSLAAGGYVAAGDFGGFAGTGVPRELTEALRDLERKNKACG
jgi:hypothetical protein